MTKSKLLESDFNLKGEGWLMVNGLVKYQGLKILTNTLKHNSNFAN